MDRRQFGRPCFLKHVRVDKCLRSSRPASSSYSLKIYILNVCSIAKPHAFQQTLTDVITYKPDIIILTEMHLSSKHSSDLFSISEYILYRKDRSNRKERWNMCLC